MSETVLVSDVSGLCTLYDSKGACVGQVNVDTGRALIGNRFYSCETRRDTCDRAALLRLADELERNLTARRVPEGEECPEFALCVWDGFGEIAKSIREACGVVG